MNKISKKKLAFVFLIWEMALEKLKHNSDMIKFKHSPLRGVTGKLYEWVCVWLGANRCNAVKNGGKSSMPLFSTVQKGFVEPFELVFRFPFILTPKNCMSGKNLWVLMLQAEDFLMSAVKGWKRKKGDLGNKKKKGRLHLETFIRSYSSFFW